MAAIISPGWSPRIGWEERRFPGVVLRNEIRRFDAVTAKTVEGVGSQATSRIVTEEGNVPTSPAGPF